MIRPGAQTVKVRREMGNGPQEGGGGTRGPRVIDIIKPDIEKINIHLDK
jgi:hypothetical protein